MVFDRYWSHIQDFKTWTELPNLSAPVFSKPFKKWNPELWNLQTYSFQNIWGLSQFLLRCPGGSKDKHNCFWEESARSKYRNHRNEEVEGSPISKLKSYKFKLKQNNITELSHISFPQIYHNNCPTITTHIKHARLSGFFRIFYNNHAEDSSCRNMSRFGH